MNKLTVIAAALALSAFLSAFAGLTFAQDVAPSEKSRAAVMAELQQARSSGELARIQAEVGVDGYLSAAQATVAVQSASAAPAAAVPTGSKTRAQVVQELSLARASGALETLHGEGGPGYFPLPQARLNGDAVYAGTASKGN